MNNDMCTEILNNLKRFIPTLDLNLLENKILESEGKLNNFSISSTPLKVGNHIAVRRKLSIANITLPYYHHGIVSSTLPIKVIHPSDRFSQFDKKFMETSLEDFMLESSELYCDLDSDCLTLENSLKIAQDHLTRYVEYNLVDYNCETFANICCPPKEDKPNQVDVYLDIVSSIVDNEFMRNMLKDKNMLKNMIVLYRARKN